MASQYQPPEEQISKVLDKYTPRQIAIAYLRSSRRARQAETAFGVLDKVSAAALSVATGDTKGAAEELAKATRQIKRNKKHHA